MNQLQNNISSLEVAEMVGRRHDQVLRDIKTIIEHFGDDHKSVGNYFIEGTYRDNLNRIKPCYLLTKKGCELYGTRMTGEKGTQFAVQYIDRFNEMEQQTQNVVPLSKDQAFEMTKKTLYLILHKKRYETKKYCINQNDMLYKINQILYYLDTYNNLYLDEDYLNDLARKSLKNNLEKILEAVKVDKTLSIDRDILATIQ